MRRFMTWLLVFGVAALAGCSSAKVTGDSQARRLAIDTEAKAEKPEKQEEAGAPFRLPGDRAGQLLGEVLPPRPKVGALRRADRPTPPTAPAPRSVDPDAALPSGTAVVLRLPSPPRKDVLRPRFVIDEGFDGAPDEPVPPRSPSFDAGKPTAVAAEDVSIPESLPVMAQPSLDRVPIDDVTFQASSEAALTAMLPVRTTPAPFSRGGVPEPFENRTPLTTAPPDEESAPVADGPAVPKR